MATNRYAATCAVCDCTVPANGGRLTKGRRGWEVRHPACEGGASSVVQFRFSSGATMTRNRRGRCEDAPCCGCCTF
jgi:hypothetical protein